MDRSVTVLGSFCDPLPSAIGQQATDVVLPLHEASGVLSLMAFRAGALETERRRNRSDPFPSVFIRG